MFTTEDFAVFQIAGLDPRMNAIRAEIQPKFQGIATAAVTALETPLGETLKIHIAQHRRRTTNAPDFTWCALGGDQRGYKKYPHFTLGINGEYVVVWLSFIDNPLREGEMAQAFIEQPALFKNLPADFKLNLDHTVNNYEPVTPAALDNGLTRWRDVKKGEFQIGRVILKDDPIWQTPAAAQAWMTETYQLLVPLYRAAYEVREAI